MHILLTNDDGPPDDNTSPYIKYFLDEVQRSTDWKVTIVIPNQQRSWIGKAHFAGRVLEVSYIYTLPSTESHNEGINSFEGPFAERHQSLRQTHQEWHLVNSTPAACADLGLHHLTSHDEPIDLVISGPNYGKNSGNLYILGSGTVGAAMEAVTHGAKAIALSYEFRSQAKDHNQLKEAAKLSLKIARKLHENLTKNFEVDLYSVNIPLVPSLDTNNTSVMYAPIQNNSWKSIYASLGNGRFGWAPDFKQVYKDGLVDAKHSDNRVLLNDNVSVTPLKAAFQAVEPLVGDVFRKNCSTLIVDRHVPKNIFLITTSPNSYTYDILVSAFRNRGFEISNSKRILEDIKADAQLKVFHYGEYEELDIDLLQSHPKQYFVSSFIYRKALIRKHYLANTVLHYCAKFPTSILKRALPEAYSIEVDYAEFLDDALDEAFELRQELETSKKTWILKPSMADKGQGIRLFRNTEELQAIFESFEEDVHESDDEGEQEGIMVSQLRHFVVQKYQENPLLLKFYNNRKFHLRVYAVAVGDISVFVYEEMLTLFAESTYMGVSDLEDLTSHLTNTCLQEGKDPLVIPFWQLAGLDSSKKNQIFDQVKCITGELFKAATSVDKINFQPLENALEFYGLDFLVDEDHSVKLLEVNAYPDFKQTGYELKGIIEKLMTSMAHLSAKQFFAEPLQDESNVLHLVFRNDFHPPKHAK
ncbi:hypothetical protein CA3LBN_003519 [Candidozyma haemuli]|uniref:Survival protein SurE-like phosphatase/nucleotidase domain-containing protein n=1 Tax=Candidozyma haemuli TaxID=45357 RepID=A0ABX8I7E7_9ASCO|nr:hypothetical protein CA3LBN_003519 [[Candida] haemuloni]